MVPRIVSSSHTQEFDFVLSYMIKDILHIDSVVKQTQGCCLRKNFMEPTRPKAEKLGFQYVKF